MPSEWFIKRFKKSKAIRALINYPDKRSKLHWCLPKGKTVTIGEDTYSCDATKDYFTMIKGIPTFIYNKGKVEPLDLDQEVVTNNVMSSEEFNSAINQKVIKEIFSATDNSLDSNTVMIFGIVILALIIVGGGYFIYQMLTDMQTTINELRETIRIISGQ